MRFQFFILFCLFAVGCSAENTIIDGRELSAESYHNKLHGAWLATMVANHSGIDLQGIYLDQPGSGDSIELVLLDQWSTDDDTLIEWVYLHTLETHGIDPHYEQIRDEWVDHLNHDIWVSALRARQLMEQGIVPPETSNPMLNPEGVWSIGAQLQTELFGMIAPGLPDEAMRRARYFARVTNSGLAVDASAFYAHMYAQAFFENDVAVLIEQANAAFAVNTPIHNIASSVQQWHAENPDNWRVTRQKIRDVYDDDPEWWAAKVNFAATLMALLYGEGDLLRTLNIAGLAGWDADNNMTSAAGLLGIIYGYASLPEPIKSASDVYFNEDVTGDLPRYDSVRNFATRTQRIGELVIEGVGGKVSAESYIISE